MRALVIAWKDLTIALRDRAARRLLFLMPLVLIAILGLAFGNAFSGQSPSIPAFHVGLADHDGGPLAELLLPSNDLFVVEVGEEAALRARVARGELAAMLVIPKGAGAAFRAGQPVQLEVFTDAGSQVRGAVFDSFVRAAATGRTQQVQVEVRQVFGRRPITALQYYSAGMVAMFVFFGAQVGAKSILDERQTYTLQRLLAAPIARSSIVAGKLMGTFAIALSQLLVLVAGTRLIFGVRWGDPGGVLLLSVATALAVAGITVLIAAIARTSRAADLMGQLVIQGMAALGGSMVPLFSFPPVLRELSKFTVNRWVITGFTELMGGAGASVVMPDALVLAIAGVACMGLGAAALRIE